MMCSRVGASLSWLGRHSKALAVNGNNVSILNSPSEYFQWLKSQILAANHQIRLSSLYLGTGDHEKELIGTIQKVLKQKPNLECHIVLDYLRGNRGHPNSVNMLRSLLENFPSQFTLSMYHTPKLKGILKQVIPERFNEIVGVQHTKLCLFDDNLLVTGANLSEDYFTNRQDRYIAFYSCPELTNYLTNLHQVICQHSFFITPDGPIPPSTHSVQYHETSFYKALQPLLQVNTRTESHTDTRAESHTDTGTESHTDTRTESHTDTRAESHIDTKAESYTDTRTESHTHTDIDNTNFDTLVFPLLQMGHYNIVQDEIFTEALLKSDQDIYLASGYFNLPDNYTKAIIAGHGNCTILASSPQSMGFYGAKGIAGYVPQLYSNLAIQFMKQVDQIRERIRYMEYYRPGWTYHCKGIWCYNMGESLPMLSLIGSSNYGYRSLRRDLEVQVAIVTQNKTLQHALDRERQAIFEYGKLLELEEVTQHRVDVWVKCVTGLFKHYV